MTNMELLYVSIFVDTSISLIKWRKDFRAESIILVENYEWWTQYHLEMTNLEWYRDIR